MVRGSAPDTPVISRSSTLRSELLGEQRFESVHALVGRDARAWRKTA